MTKKASDTRKMGGMVETTWSGKKMWKCPSCGATTFDRGQSKVHSCAKVKFADEVEQEATAE